MKFFEQHPLVQFCICFIVGIILADNISTFPSFSVYILSIGLLFFALLLTRKTSFRHKNLFGIFFCLFLLVLGFGHYKLNNESRLQQHFSTNISTKNICIGIVSEKPEERSNSIKIILQVEAIKTDSSWKKCCGKLLCYLQKDSAAKALEYGNKIIANAAVKEIETPNNPYEFDYKRYLSLKNIFHQTYLQKDEWGIISPNNYGNRIRKTGIILQNRCLSLIKDKNFSKDEYAIAGAILLGDGESIDKELIHAYQNTGVMHILSVSGLHVGLFAMVLQYALVFMNKKKWQLILRSIIIIGSIWLYALITGLSPSVLRSAVMFTFVSIGKNSNRNTDIYNSLAISALLLLVIDPQMLYAVGFQLSYLAVVGIAYLQKHIKQWWKVKNKLLSYCWELIAVSIAAQLVTAPLSLYYFHLFPNYFILSNLATSPISAAIIPLGMLTITCSFIYSPLAQMFGYCLEFVIKIMNKSIVLINQLPFSTSQNISITNIENILLYIFIILLCNALIFHKKKLFLQSLLILLILLVTLNLTKLQQMKQNTIIIYHIKKHSAVEFLKGNHSTVIADSSLLCQPQLLEFPTQNFIIKSGIKHRNIFSFNNPIVSPQSNFINFNGYTIGVINKTNAKNNYLQKITVDCLLLQNNPNTSLLQLLEYYDTRLIIADGSNNAYSIQRWIGETLPSGITFHFGKYKLSTIRNKHKAL